MLKIEVLTDIKDAVNSMATLQKKSTSSLDKIAKDGTSAFNSIGKSIVVMNQGIELLGKAWGAVSGAIGSTLGEGIKLSMIQENAINDMNQALKSTGTYSDQASNDMQAFASSLQQTSIYGDEALLKTMALGAQMSKLSGQELKDATLAATNMASALNIDLDSAMRLIAKSATDGGSGLKRYGIEVEKGKTNSQSLANAISKVNEQFAGSAASKVNTYSGAMQQAQNSWGDMLEKIGDFITKNPVVTAAINIASKMFSQLGTIIGDISPDSLNNFIANGVIKVIEGFKFLVEAINPVITGFKLIGAVGSTIFDGLKLAVNTTLMVVSGFASGTLNIITSMVNSLPQSLVPDSWAESINNANEAMTLVTESFKETNDQFVTDTKESFAGIGESFVATIDEEKLELIKGVLSQTENAIAKSVKKTSKDMAKANKAQLKDDKDTLKERQSDLELFYGAWANHLTQNKEYHELTNKQRVEGMSNALGQISSLTSSSNKTLFAIGKSAAISQATVDGYLAVQRTLAETPYPINFALAALVGVATAANVAKIASQSPPKFATGGIVPGNSFSGDNVPALVNSGEMILNKGQQTRLFNQINSGGGGSLESAIYSLGDRIANIEIVLRADDIEIARSVNRAIDDGYIIGATA